MDSNGMLQVIFFCTSARREPVREWLKDLEKEDRKIIGEDIKLVQYRWPLGLPWVRKMKPNLWEIRSNLGHGRTARVFITVQDNQIASVTWIYEKDTKDAQKRIGYCNKT